MIDCAIQFLVVLLFTAALWALGAAVIAAVGFVARLIFEALFGDGD